MNIIVKNEISDIMTKDIKNLLLEMRDFTHYPDTILSPFDLNNMEEGINLLMKHIAEDNNIFIQVDSDVDGLTSAALMYLAIKRIKSDAKITYRLHPDKTHGIKIGTVPEDTDLIIMPDASSNEYDKHKFYKEKGMDILVLDHHGSDKYSEYACVINNQLSENYANKDLSGVGVVAKFLEGVEEITNVGNILGGLYDLVAVGLIADLMSLNNSETMFYVEQGLKNIRQPMLLFMGAESFYIKDNTSISAKDISYSLAPAFNAVFRVGTKRDRELMFEAFINPDKMVENKKRNAEEKMINITKESYRLCNNARSRQNSRITKALKIIEEKNYIAEADNVVIISVPTDVMERELSGLVAMKISDKYQKPALVLMKDKNNNLSGSGRSIDEGISFRDFIDNSDLAIFAEGHDSAFGVSFSDHEDIDVFLDYCDDNYREVDSKIYVDFKINPQDITLELAKKIDELKPYYGKSFESPSFYIEDFIVPNDVDILGKTKDTVKIKYRDIEFIKFKDENLVYAIQNSSKNLVMNIVGSIEVNEWRGMETAQLVIKQYEITGEKFSF